MQSTSIAYFHEAERLLAEVLETQADAIAKTTNAIADALASGGTLFTFGTGHSHMLAEELFYRAGGLVKVHPIFDEPLMLHVGASRSSKMERLEGYAKTLLELTPDMRAGDVLLLFSNSGRNAVPIELALAAKEKGVVTACITNLKHTKSCTSRHASGKRLFEVCDIAIDNCGCIGDAAIAVGKYMCSPTSTVVGAAILEAIVCGVVEQMLAEGKDPEVFCSSNVDGGDEKNAGYLAKYRGVIPML